MSNKEIVKQAQAALKELGYPVTLGHVYEMFSKLSGHKSWNVAKSKGVAFVEHVKSVGEITAVAEKSEKTFTVKIYADGDNIELKKYYRISAKDETEAKAIIKEYLYVQENISHEDLSKYKFKFEVTKLLLEKEDYNDFIYNNWEVTENGYEKRLGDAYENTEETNLYFRA